MSLVLHPLAFEFAIVTLFCLAAYMLAMRGGERVAKDVLEDLQDLHEPQSTPTQSRKETPRPGSSAYSAMGLFSRDSQRHYERKQRFFPFIFSFLFVAGYLALGSGRAGAAIALGIIGAGLGYLFAKSRSRRLEEKYTRSLEYFLPIVMERLVMAVQAGLDVIPALKAIVEIDQKTLENRADGAEPHRRSLSRQTNTDPVSELLVIVIKLSESGLSFEQALRDVASLVNCSALRHAFIHLAVAQKEGGEIVMPLRELSDSTQLYFQESSEEEIAKLPVKATLPLICTFAGLILCFLTSPLIQVLTLTARAMPK